MPNCPINLSSFDPSCDALQSVAGLRDVFYFCRRADITALTISTLTANKGTITALDTVALYKFQGRKFQNSGKTDLAKSETGKTRYKQTFVARVYYDTQPERNTIEQLGFVEDLVIIAPTNSGKIEVYGASLGLAPTTASGGTGTKLEDDNTFLFTFEGDEPKLPALFNTVTTATTPEADYLTNIEYLDELVSA